MVGGDGVVVVEPPDTRPEDTVDSMRSSAWVVRDSVYVGEGSPVGDVRDNMLSTTRSHECTQADDDKKKLSVVETI